LPNNKYGAIVEKVKKGSAADCEGRLLPGNLQCKLNQQSTNIPRVPQYLSPRPNWDPPPPLPHAGVFPPEPKWGGDWGVRTHSPAAEGVGKSQFGRLKKKPSALSTLQL
jgi:hypothetical protein